MYFTYMNESAYVRERAFKIWVCSCQCAYYMKAHMHMVYSLYFHIFYYWKVWRTLVIMLFYIE